MAQGGSWEKLKQDVDGQLVEVQSPLAACRTAPDSPRCHFLPVKAFQRDEIGFSAFVGSGPTNR
jgi:hypothetical protein